MLYFSVLLCFVVYSKLMSITFLQECLFFSSRYVFTSKEWSSPKSFSSSLVKQGKKIEVSSQLRCFYLLSLEKFLNIDNLLDELWHTVYIHVFALEELNNDIFYFGIRTRDLLSPSHACYLAWKVLIFLLYFAKFCLRNKPDGFALNNWNNLTLKWHYYQQQW